MIGNLTSDPSVWQLQEETGAAAAFCVIYSRDRDDLLCQVVNQTVLPLEERLPVSDVTRSLTLPH